MDQCPIGYKCVMTYMYLCLINGLSVKKDKQHDSKYLHNNSLCMATSERTSLQCLFIRQVASTGGWTEAAWNDKFA